MTSFLKKTKGRTVNKTCVHAEAAIQSFFKEIVMRSFAEFTRKHLTRNLFFDKVKFCRSSTSLLSCEFCEICKNTFFAEHDRATVLDYSSIKVVKGELANENLNYDSKTKAYVPI